MSIALIGSRGHYWILTPFEQETKHTFLQVQSGIRWAISTSFSSMCNNSLKLDLFFFGVTSCFISILLEFMFDSLDLF